MDDIIVPELQNVDTTLIIDPDTRTIDVGSDFLLGVETDNDAERKILMIAANSELVPLFNIKLLSILSTADVLGRIGSEKEEQVEKINYFVELSKELGVYDTFYKFSNNYTKFKYLNKEVLWYNDSLFSNPKCEVILTVGLPGTGKDTYIAKYLNNYKVISLDNIV